MRKKEHIEDLINSSLTGILERSSTLEKKYQIAIYQELSKWRIETPKLKTFRLSNV